MSSARMSMELFVRSLTPSGAAQRQEAILDRLERLDERGVIDGYTVTVWGEQVVPGSLAARTDAGKEIVATVDSFEEWASAMGVSVDRFFEEQSVESAVTGERYAATSLPVLAMAEYVDGDLAWVTPHEDEDGVHTVVDRLDRIEEGTEANADRAATSAV